MSMYVQLYNASTSQQPSWILVAALLPNAIPPPRQEDRYCRLQPLAITTSSKSSSYSAQPQETQLNHFKHSQVSPPLSLTSPKIIITHSSDWNWHIHCPIVHNDNNNKDTKPFLSSSPGAHLFNPMMFFASKMVSGEQSSLFKTDRRHYSGINHPHCLVLIIHPADWC